MVRETNIRLNEALKVTAFLGKSGEEFWTDKQSTFLHPRPFDVIGE